MTDESHFLLPEREKSKDLGQNVCERRNRRAATIRCLLLKLVQALLLLHQVALRHLVFEQRHAVPAFLHQRRVLIGHLELPGREEEGLLLLPAAQGRSWQSSSADHRAAVVHHLQVVLHRRGRRPELPASAELAYDADGGARQQRQGHQAEDDGGDEGRRGVAGRQRRHRRGGGGVLAAGAHEARGALAHRPGEVGVAGAAVAAGEAVAGAHPCGAVLAAEAQRARAGEVARAGGAGAGVAAGTAGAVVDAGVAARPREARAAAAREAVAEVQAPGACRKESDALRSRAAQQTNV